MVTKAKEKRSRRKKGPTLFVPGSGEKFQLSRYRIERFLDCRWCFWADMRYGLKRPEPRPYTLNNAVDKLVKTEFDIYRKLGQPHPLMVEFGIAGVPFNGARIDEWRNNWHGMRFLHSETNLDIMGAPDDIWLVSTSRGQELAVVDAKATSSKEGVKPIQADWWKSYRRQIDIYRWLLKRQDAGYPVSDTAYFLHFNGIGDAEEFRLSLKFTPNVVAYVSDDSWVEQVIRDAYACLMSDEVPEPSEECEHCRHRRETSRLLQKLS